MKTSFLQYNLPTLAEHGTDINGRISQDPEYRRSYNLPQNTHKACNKLPYSKFYYVQNV